MEPGTVLRTLKMASQEPDILPFSMVKDQQKRDSQPVTVTQLFRSQQRPVAVRSTLWTKWLPGFSWNTVSIPLRW